MPPTMRHVLLAEGRPGNGTRCFVAKFFSCMCRAGRAFIRKGEQESQTYSSDWRRARVLPEAISVISLCSLDGAPSHIPLSWVISIACQVNVIVTRVIRKSLAEAKTQKRRKELTLNCVLKVIL